MADRAFIIAVENYASATEGFTARTLPGTVAAAQAFGAWLEEKWKREGKAGKVYFCSEPKVQGGRGATRSELIDTLINLGKEGKNATENLFVYFSGHGFRLKDDKEFLADVIVAADFIDLQHSTDCCWKLGALIERLRCLGHGTHYYFIDACRNEVRAIASAIMPPCDIGEDPAVFVLQSAVPGAPALVGGPFPQTLVAGLRGGGIAKCWIPPIKDSMQINFESLLKYLGETLAETQPIHRHADGTVPDERAVLATLRPVPYCTLDVSLQAAGTLPGGSVTLVPYQQGRDTAYPFNGSTLQLRMPPDHYTVSISIPGWSVVPPDAQVRLYDDAKVTFEVGPPLPAPPPVPSAPEGVKRPAAGSEFGMFRVEIPEGAQVEIRHIDLGHQFMFLRSAEAMLPTGIYRTSMRTVEGRLIHQGEVTVRADVPTELKPADWHGSLPLESIASRLPHADGGVDFSEELQGPVTDPDLGVWLTIIGGGRILGSMGDYSKIGPLPLANFARELPSASPLYLLAGLPTSDLPVRAAIHGPDGESLAALAIAEPPTMPGLREAVAHPPAGQCFLTLKVGDQPPLTVASLASANRCTLVVLTLGDNQQPQLAQYLVPLGHLMTFLDPQVLANINRRRTYENTGPLKALYQLSLMYRAFRRRRDLAKELGQGIYEELLYGKWVDPIGAALATYECVRRNQRQYLPIVSANMSQYFSDLPDTAAIMKLASPADAAVMPRGVPLFVDGVRVFGVENLTLPFDARLMDYSSPWTSWRGAVQL